MLKTMVQPMYELLGTPEEHKKLLLYDCDHYLPKVEASREILAWLDRYLGPVGRAGEEHLEDAGTGSGVPKP